MIQTEINGTLATIILCSQIIRGFRGFCSLVILRIHICSSDVKPGYVSVS